MPSGAFRAHSGDPFGGAGGRFASAPPDVAEWLAQGRRAVAQARSLSRLVARRIAGVSQRAVLLECACNSGDSRERAFNGTSGRLTVPTTRPTISAPSGVCKIPGWIQASITAKPGGDPTPNLLF